MMSKLPQKKNIMYQLAVFSLLYMIFPLASFGQTQPPAPAGNSDQYFCSSTSWMNAGYTKSGDTFEELYINGENLTFYEDNGGSPGNVISNPSTYVLVDGATYYVTQTVNGVESTPLTITVTDRECGCLKNPDFETFDGQPSSEDYTFYHQDVDDGYKTCGGSIDGLTPTAMSTTIDDTSNGSVASFVTPGQDPNVNVVSRTNNNNSYSKYAMRLNDPNTGLDVSHMEKDFVAGEVFSFSYAFVLDNGSGVHEYQHQPYVNIALYDGNGDLFAQRCVITRESDCILIEQSGSDFLYTTWSCIQINTLDIIGGQAKLVVSAADCVDSIHEGYFYMDDFFVGDNVNSPCEDPGFGYIAMEDFTASSSSLDCVVNLQSTQQSCGADVNTSLPFPIEVCGSVTEPISNTNPASIQDLSLNITRNGNLIGSVSNPVISGDQFCFTIYESDINVADAYGALEISTEVAFNLDCGDPYTIQISDSAELDICPTAGCVDPLETCDVTGTGIGDFNLDNTSAQIRGTEWTTADVDISYYKSEDDAIEEDGVISSTGSYNNTNPYSETLYARLDWHPQGTTTSCFYIMTVDLNVYELPDVNTPDRLFGCGEGPLNLPIIATPTNITNLTDVTYTWRKNGQLLAHSGSFYRATEPGTYEVTVDEQNCSVTRVIEVEQIDFDIDLGDEDPIQLCGDATSTTLTANIIDNSTPAIDEANLNYLWNTGETTQSIEVSDSGVYTVEVDYDGDCLEQESIDVIIATEPDIEPLADFQMCTDDAVEVTATVNNLSETEVEFVWYRDGQVLPAETNATISVTEDGTYRVEVNEIGYDFCSQSQEFTAEYYDNADCVITQGLSPDVTVGQNDCLDLKFLADRTGITNIKLYSRYGRLVYDENDYVDGFCGQDMDGDVLPTGTYYYVLVLDAEDPIFEKVKKGWIYINREAN